MKEVGVCRHCGRKVYVNNLDLCKRCNLIVGVELKKQAEAEAEPEEEESMSMEELGIAPAAEGKEEEKKEEAPPEEEKKEEKGSKEGEKKE